MAVWSHEKYVQYFQVKSILCIHLPVLLSEEVSDAISDSDSYVYLAAINALAEAACYGSTYLRDLIALFKNFRVSTLDQENYVMINVVEYDPIACFFCRLRSCFCVQFSCQIDLASYRILMVMQLRRITLIGRSLFARDFAKSWVKYSVCWVGW